MDWKRRDRYLLPCGRPRLWDVLMLVSLTGVSVVVTVRLILCRSPPCRVISPRECSQCVPSYRQLLHLMDSCCLPPEAI